MSDGVIVGTTEENGEGYGYGGQTKSNSGNTVKFLYVPADTEKGEVLVESFDGDSALNPKAVSATTSTVRKQTVVATKNQGATAGFQFCVVQGYCKALVNGSTSVAKGDFLEVTNGADNAVKDGTTQTANSFAIACEAQTAGSDTLTDVYLLGQNSVVSAS